MDGEVRAEQTGGHTNTPTPKIHNPFPQKRGNRICRPDHTVITTQDCIPLLRTQLPLPGFLPQRYRRQDRPDAGELVRDGCERGV
jgi:hypothetical protein